MSRTPSRTIRWILLTTAYAALLPGSAGAQGRVETIPLDSEVYQNTRMLRVWLPAVYEELAAEGARFPVLYLNDGQNLFDSSTAVFNQAEWKVDETVSRLIRDGSIEPIVVVGIDNAGRRGRAHEYLPYPDESLDPPEPDPQGRRYSEFLRHEVIPTIEDRFSVQRSPQGRALGGSSYGALVASFVAATDDTLFDGLLLESPSFYVDDGHIFEDVSNARHTLSRVYLGVGTNELTMEGCEDHEGNRAAVRDVRRMHALLRQTARDRIRFKVVVEDCAVHHEHAWSRRLPAALRFLFGC